jgi:hypothetical protein
MKTNDIVEIIKSPAFTFMVGTICLIVVMRQVPIMVSSIKEMNKKD